MNSLRKSKLNPKWKAAMVAPDALSAGEQRAMEMILHASKPMPMLPVAPAAVPDGIAVDVKTALPSHILDKVWEAPQSLVDQFNNAAFQDVVNGLSHTGMKNSFLHLSPKIGIETCELDEAPKVKPNRLMNALLQRIK
jgi:hypothetical protein